MQCVVPPCLPKEPLDAITDRSHTHGGPLGARGEAGQLGFREPGWRNQGEKGTWGEEAQEGSGGRDSKRWEIPSWDPTLPFAENNPLLS